MSRTAGKPAPHRESYTAAEWELLNDFAAFLVHCDLQEAETAEAASEQPAATDEKPPPD